MFDAEHDASLILAEDDTGQTGPSPIPRFRGRKHIGGEGMQTAMNKMTSPVRYLAAGTWVALFALLALCLGALPAMAITQPPPIVVTGPTVVIGDLQFGGATGGWAGGQAPLGGPLAARPQGRAS